MGDISNHFTALANFRLRLKDPAFQLDTTFIVDYDLTMNRRASHSSNSSQGVKLPKLATTEDIQQMQRMLMRAADVGHATKEWPAHVEWSKRITQEFHGQGDEELELGLPVGPLNSREGFNFAKSQNGFLTFLCLPLLLEIAHFDEPQHGGEGFMVVHDACSENAKRWLDSNGEEW